MQVLLLFGCSHDLRAVDINGFHAKIAVEQDEVRGKPRRQRADLAAQTDRLCGRERRGGESFDPARIADACGDQDRKPVPLSV